MSNEHGELAAEMKTLCDVDPEGRPSMTQRLRAELLDLDTGAVGPRGAQPQAAARSKRGHEESGDV